MIKNVLCGIANVDVYPIVSLILFLLVFAGSAVWAFTMKKSQVAELCRMPLEDSSIDQGDKP